MTDLTAWLRSQLDTDEAWARAASRAYKYADEGSRPPEGGVHWRWVAGEHWETVTADPAVDEFVAAPGEPCRLATVETWPKTYRDADGSIIRVWQMPTTYTDQAVEVDAAAAGHITRNDPAHVLRTVAAHRAILARHSPDEAWIPPGCRACSQSEWGVDWPCADVLSIAEIYQDRPGWDPSWKVET